MPGPFLTRHVGVRADDFATMLEAVGHTSVDDLLDAAVPDSIRWRELLKLPDAISEPEVLAELAAIAGQNQVLTSMIGQGYYGSFTPEVIRRNVVENPAWYTSYTPYQPEISQGRLEVLLRFQTMVAELTGMDLAGASLLDDATAAAEAMTMSLRLSKSASRRFVVDAALHPQVIDVVVGRAEPLGIEVDVVDPTPESIGSCFGVLLAHVATTGGVRVPRLLVDAAHAVGACVSVHTDLLACVLFEPPGAWGADMVVGSAQRFGVPMFAGGPHAGFLATNDAHRRQLPGRLVGVSVDAHGRPAYRLALQTREQHIRRDKATSNICTAQALLANIAALYACWHGLDGLVAIAQRVHGHASRLVGGLRTSGHSLSDDSWFDTVTVRLASVDAADQVVGAARASGINLRRVDANSVGVACDETTSPDHVDRVLAAFGVTSSEPIAPGAVDSALARTSVPLTHEVFQRSTSETDMLRELRRLADFDLALDRTMIPLGSCTMKLNATTEMVPVTWPEFADLHPFAPADQLAGTRAVVDQLESMLAEITGYDEVSLQPNAGSQGELAGLLAIRGYHRSRGDEQRTVCLIPASAHGTNAASAVMAGMEVVAVNCDALGNVDVDDLVARLSAAGDRVAALMVTYPSTHGVFEERIVEICDLVHAAGGQVYVDGANMNAMVGVARPGSFGGDVSHLNLHKTFCIPHGGGGPGVGPVCVRSHLAPFLPSDGHRRVDGIGSISAAPWGSAGILTIPWVYLRLMGADGLRDATSAAILSANYIAARLEPHFPVLYRGRTGLVAHECILDIRALTTRTGISVDDIAKRLVDHGFHAPTMSFPVPGTLMVEPTESESLAELDRFCDAMISIRAEIEQVANGVWPRKDNPLVNAPHTAGDLLADEWAHPYPRSLGGYPTGAKNPSKYWPPVSRIDGAYGDRNVMCSCPPLSDLATPQLQVTR